MTKSRILWLDALKAFAIIVVILGHCLQFLGASGILYKYIYAVHMPLFMAISGYCSYRASISFSNIKKRFFQLVIPFLAWPIVWYVVKMDFSGITVYYLHLPLNPDTGLWFLYVLFLISVLDYCRYRLLICIDVNQLGGGKRRLARYAYEYSIIGTVLLMLFVYWTYKRLGMPGNWISFVALYYPYYMLGCVMRKHNECLEMRIEVLGSVGLVIYFLGTYLVGDSLIWQPLLATSGIMGAFFVFCKFCNCKMPQLLVFTGMSTLGIYAVHQPMINYVKHIIETPLCADVALTFVITYVISIVVVRLLKMSKITRFLLLGMNK